MSATALAAVAGTPRARMTDRPFLAGGLAFIAAGVLFLVKYLLDVAVGPLPSTGAEILVWKTANEPLLAMANEVLFFAAGFLVPAVVALHRSLARVDGILAPAGSLLVALLIPTIFVLDIVHGRLVFPVYGFGVETPAVAELVVALYEGGLHAVGLLFALATMLLSFGLWRGGFGRGIAAFGVVAATGDILGAYPESIGPGLVLVSQVLFAGWFLALGWKLCVVRAPEGR